MLNITHGAVKELKKTRGINFQSLLCFVHFETRCSYKKSVLWADICIAFTMMHDPQITIIGQIFAVI